MLRTLFVTLLLSAGALLALKGPLEGLLLYLWIAYFRPEQWVWTDTFRALNLSYFAGLYLVFRAALSRESFRFDVRAVLLFAFLLHSSLSTWASPYSAYSQPFWLEFLKSTIITYLIGALATTPQRLRLVIFTIALSLGFEGARQGWGDLLTHPGAQNINENPFLGDNNGTAVGMLMLVPLMVALARTSRAVPERWLHRFMAVGVLYRGISTYSRGGFLAAAALGLSFVLRSPRAFRALIGATLVGMLTLSVLPDQFWARMGTIVVEDGQEREASSAGRLHFWAVALRMAEANPFLGVGHNAFNVAYNRYDFSYGQFGGRRSVHSAWFGVLAELGFVGFALFVANIGLALWTCRRASKLAAKGIVSAEIGHFAVGVEGALIVASVGGAFVIFQYTEILWHMVGLSMALHFATVEALAKQAAGPVVTAPPTRITVNAPVPAKNPVRLLGPN